jgi:hypothetical protein
MQVIAMDGESRPQLPSPSVGETPVWHKPLAPSLNPKRTQATLGCDKEGYFFVGGQWAADGDKKYMVGQMFVQYELPVKKTHPYPIVMVHGTAQTGSNFLGTPDGRPGWASYFRDHGYRVYVVDQVPRSIRAIARALWSLHAALGTRHGKHLHGTRDLQPVSASSSPHAMAGRPGPSREMRVLTSSSHRKSRASRVA